MSDNSPTLYCANHPDVETSLRCSKCGKPICPRCAVLTPTGYKCKECVRGQQKAFETAKSFDYLIAFVVAAIFSYLGSLLAGFMSFFIIFLAPIAGGIIAEIVRFAVQRRRSKRLFQVATVAAVIGSLPRLLLLGVELLASLGVGQIAGIAILLPLVWQVLYTSLIASTVYYRLGGIRM